MREIKFRAWHKQLGIILHDMKSEGNEKLFRKIKCEYAEEIKVCHDCVMRENEPDMGYYGGGYWDNLFTDECEYMQYTGLSDKNGKEVYEGDIVTCSSGCPHRVEWAQEHGGTYSGGMPAFYLSGLNSGYAWTGDEEIIGNIHEHSELLS